MKNQKLKTLLKLTIGSSLCFLGYNLYIGEDKFYDCIYRNLLPIAHKWINPEFSHLIAIKCAKFNIGTNFNSSKKIYPNLECNLWNINFSNPIGLAAGFDKHGEAINGLSKIGFGFIEVGSITPNPQEGNEKPRLFRSIEDQSVINRYGFNSVGHKTAKSNILKQKFFTKEFPIGINLGKNKDSIDAINDYVLGLKEFKNLANYFVINISSPNTPGLRNLQNEKELEQMLKEITSLKKNYQELSRTPFLIKIAPDLDDKQLEQIAKLVLKYKIDGLIISNTTIDKSCLKNSEMKSENGGLSGKALEKQSTEIIKKMFKMTKGKIPIIGVGGISDGKGAYEKILAGASLLQIYTAMTFEGPLIVNKIKNELSEILKENGYSNVLEAVGKGNV